MATTKSNKAKATAFFGKEPVVTESTNVSQLVGALNWLRQEQTPESSKRWLSDFMKKNNYSKDQINLVTSKMRYMVSTWFSVARLLTNGSTLPEGTESKLRKEIETLIQNVYAEEATKPSKPKAIEIPSDVLEYIDSLVEKSKNSQVNEDVYAYLMSRGISKPQIAEIVREYKPMFEDLVLAESGNEEVLESYSGYTKKQRKYLYGFLSNLFDQLEQVKTTKTNRANAVRTPRKINKSKLISKLRFLKESAQYRVTSIDPLKLIGAKTVVLFNTKTRDVAVYYADSSNGITVGGTSLKNFDKEKSVCKRFRKPNDVISLGVKAGFENSFTAARTKPKPARGRLNEDTIILKVWN